MTVILASGSPRRKELLSRLCVPFRVVPSEADEGPPAAGEEPERYALRLAKAKAADVALRCPGEVILAADTVVALANEILGKPRNHANAVEMLIFLQGKVHLVATGVAVRCGGNEHAGVEVSRVRMRAYSLEEARKYVATGEPMDKAGAYAIQGAGGALVDEFAGCYTAVVGLPLCLARTLLERCKVEIRTDRDICVHAVRHDLQPADGSDPGPVDTWG